MAWELVFGLIERMFVEKSGLEVEKLGFHHSGWKGVIFPLQIKQNVKGNQGKSREIKGNIKGNFGR